METLNATPEQLAFCKEVWEGRPCWLSARAGTGKTSTIKLALQQEATLRDCTVVAFNKKNQEDLSQALGPRAKVSTLHALGFAALRRYMTGLELDNSKLFELTKSVALGGRNRRALFADTMRAVACAKNWGIVPPRPGGKPKRFKEGILEDTPATWLQLQEHFELWEADLEKAREILQASNEAFLLERKLDFDDMAYLPVALGLQVFTTSKMIVDEAQDLSPLNLAMLRRSPAKIWYVGDPYQCIYTWRGASAEVLKELGLPELPLTTCWRCSQRVLSLAQTFVSDIKARSDAPLGAVIDWRLAPPDWQFHKPSVILGRNNAGLVKIALELQARGKPVCILGKELVRTLGDILDGFKGTTQARLLDETKSWFETMVDKYPHRQGELADYAKCLAHFITSNHGKAQIMKSITQLFRDEELPDAWTLSTIHKAKGREWDTVWLLNWQGRGLNQLWQKQEDRNLRYVAVTRAKNTLNVVAEDLWNPEGQGKLIDFRETY